MRMKIMELEEKIVKNKHYLIAHYPNTEMMLEQINMILDFNLSNEKIIEWFKLNRGAIRAVEELLREKMPTNLSCA